MKVNNFIQVYNVRTKHINNLNGDAIIKIITDLIKPIKYISFDNKMKLIDQAIESAKKEKYPTAYIYMYFIMNLISAYTDLEIKNGDFDTLSETKLLDVILSTFESEYKICSGLMQMCLSDMNMEVENGLH